MKKLVTKSVKQLPNARLVEFVDAQLEAMYEKENEEGSDEFKDSGPAYFEMLGVWYRVVAAKEVDGGHHPDDHTLEFEFALETLPNLIDAHVYTTRAYLETLSEKLTEWIAGAPSSAIIHYEIVEK